MGTIPAFAGTRFSEKSNLKQIDADQDRFPKEMILIEGLCPSNMKMPARSAGNDSVWHIAVLCVFSGKSLAANVRLRADDRLP
jgi:hypothetical protein